MNQAAQRRSVGRVLDALSAPGAAPTLTDLAPRAAHLLGAAGAAVSLGGDPRRGGVLVTVSTAGLGRLGEELQTTLGEGPTYRAHRTGRPSSVPDLRTDTSWVMFGHRATDHRIGGVFALPLRESSTTVGALTIYRRRPGDLTADQRDDAVTLAAFVAGYVTRRRDEGADLGLPMDGADATVINLATGMVGAHLGLDVLAALAVLRGRALGAERTLPTVAREIVARRLPLEALWD